MVIYYDAGPLQLNVICRVKGSVFPKAIAMALIPSIIAIVISVLRDKSDTANDSAATLDPTNFWSMSIMNNNAAYSSFSFVIGFLLVFRTQTAYSRFWEGTTLLQVLRGVWVGAFGSIVAFTTTSTRPQEEILEFRLKLARLMSCLHANALDFIAGESNHRQKCLGVTSLDRDTLKLMNVCEDETLMYVIVQWIQQMVLYNLNSGVISTPPPIVSRVFQDLSSGVVTLNNVRKISETPFPFPYCQALSTVIVLHASITPFVFAGWCSGPWWASIFTFLAVFLFSTINFIAAEIENPFGEDANDIDLSDLQTKFNNCLVTMLSPQSTQRPMLRHRPFHLITELQDMVENAVSAEDAWQKEATPEELRELRRFSAGNALAQMLTIDRTGREASRNPDEEISKKCAGIQHVQEAHQCQEPPAASVGTFDILDYPSTPDQGQPANTLAFKSVEETLPRFSVEEIPPTNEGPTKRVTSDAIFITNGHDASPSSSSNIRVGCRRRRDEAEASIAEARHQAKSHDFQEACMVFGSEIKHIAELNDVPKHKGDVKFDTSPTSLMAEDVMQKCARGNAAI